MQNVWRGTAGGQPPPPTLGEKCKRQLLALCLTTYPTSLPWIFQTPQCHREIPFKKGNSQGCFWLWLRRRWLFEKGLLREGGGSLYSPHLLESSAPWLSSVTGSLLWKTAHTERGGGILTTLLETAPEVDLSQSEML